jgi:release factor glutamine methyltransferase
MSAGVIHPLCFDPGERRASAQIGLTRAFKAAGLESAALDARILLCAALGIEHAALIRDPELPLGEGALTLTGFAARRLKHEPVSRILGQREFFGQIYRITPDVLDPRADTETLVEAVIAAMAERRSERLRILDLGTGSGAILGALLGHFEQASGIGIDLSPQACLCARANLFALGFRDRAFILAGRWFLPVRGRFDIIVSNPPYIESADIAVLEPEVRTHDPRLALDGGADGLAAYRAIAAAASDYLAPEGLIALEFGAGQSLAVTAILQDHGLRPGLPQLDLGGHERVILARP